MRTRRLLMAAACVWAMAVPAAWADHGPPTSDFFDCIDFPFQEDAQDFLNLNAQDFDHLDEDGDGIACEGLPRRGAGGGGGTTTTAPPTTVIVVDELCDIQPNDPRCTTTTTNRPTTTTTATTLPRVSVVGTPLARTGSEDGPWMAIAALLIATGGAFVAIGRKRRPSQT